MVSSLPRGHTPPDPVHEVDEKGRPRVSLVLRAGGDCHYTLPIGHHVEGLERLVRPDANRTRYERVAVRRIRDRGEAETRELPEEQQAPCRRPQRVIAQGD